MNYDKWPEYIRTRISVSRSILDPDGLVPKAAAGAVGGEITANVAVDWLYSVLTVLDTKASALMRLNGVLIAAAAFLLGLFGRDGGTILSTNGSHAIVIVVCAFASVISIVLCLGVVRVSWSFLGKVTVEGIGAANMARELRDLDAACTIRRRLYCSAWWISLGAALIFVGEFAVQSVHVVRSVIGI